MQPSANFRQRQTRRGKVSQRSKTREPISATEIESVYQYMEIDVFVCVLNREGNNTKANATSPPPPQCTRRPPRGAFGGDVAQGRTAKEISQIIRGATLQSKILENIRCQ